MLNRSTSTYQLDLELLDPPGGRQSQDDLAFDDCIVPVVSTAAPGCLVAVLPSRDPFVVGLEEGHVGLTGDLYLCCLFKQHHRGWMGEWVGAAVLFCSLVEEEEQDGLLESRRA